MVGACRNRDRVADSGVPAFAGRDCRRCNAHYFFGRFCRGYVPALPEMAQPWRCAGRPIHWRSLHDCRDDPDKSLHYLRLLRTAPVCDCQHDSPCDFAVQCD